MGTYTVGYFVGSLSSTSINRTLSKALIQLAPQDLEFTEITIRDLRSTVPTTTPTTHPKASHSKKRFPQWTQCCSSLPNTTARSPEH